MGGGFGDGSGVDSLKNDRGGDGGCQQKGGDPRFLTTQNSEQLGGRVELDNLERNRKSLKEQGERCTQGRNDQKKREQ